MVVGTQALPEKCMHVLAVVKTQDHTKRGYSWLSSSGNYRLDNRQDTGDNSCMPTSGPELRRERRAKEITTVAVHTHMGVSRATLYTLERAAEVDPAQAKAYRTALEALTVAKENVA